MKRIPITFLTQVIGWLLYWFLISYINLQYHTNEIWTFSYTIKWTTLHSCIGFLISFLLVKLYSNILFKSTKIVYIIIGVVLFTFAFKKFRGTEKGRDTIDSLLLKLPVFGELLRKVAVAKFTRTMGTMLASGVAILEALDIVAKTAGNRTVEKAIYNVRTGIAERRTMADPLSESGVFPPMVCQMIGVGESTGALDAMLEKIADFYDEEVDQAVENLTSLIEPFMLVFLGVTIGGLVVAMYLPIFKMGSVV